MKNMLLTMVTAAALVLSPVTAAPARAADNRQAIGAILGIVALAAIANEVRKNREDRQVTHRRQATPYQPLYNSSNSQKYGRSYGRGQKRVLPRECLRVFEGRRHDRIVFPARCLNRAGVRTNKLPRRCETQISARRGAENVYGGRCLADAGWTLPRIAGRR